MVGLPDFAGAAPPTVARTPAGLTNLVAEGQNAISQPFWVWNSGTGTVEYAVTDDAPWILVTPTNGTGASETNTHLVIFDTTNVAIGAQTATVTIAGGATGTQTVQVVLMTTNHQFSASLVLSVTEESGIRLTNGNSSPFPWRLTNGEVRLYHNGAGGIASALSTNDGWSFTADPGTRISGGDPAVVTTTNNLLRMYFKRNSTNEVGWLIDKIFSANSSDGLNWTDEGLRFEPALGGQYMGTNYTSYASVPEALDLGNNRLRLYYVSNKATITSVLGGGGIGTSYSTNGLDFQDESGPRVDVVGFADPAVIRLTSGYYWMVTSNPRDPDPEKPAANELPGGLYSYLSEDGTNFFNRQPLLVTPLGNSNYISRATDPGILRLTGDYYRVYFADPMGDSHIRSAVVTVQVVEADANLNDIPDHWELQYFGSLTNVTASSDADGDHFLDRFEYWAGTDPTNHASFLELQEIAAVTGGVAVSWSSVSNHSYGLDRTTNLIGSTFTNIKSGILAVSSMNTETDTTTVGNGPWFYRVHVEP